eukprot:scaffold247391_cov21-Tisochrysis_lutea.AAC.1
MGHYLWGSTNLYKAHPQTVEQAAFSNNRFLRVWDTDLLKQRADVGSSDNRLLCAWDTDLLKQRAGTCSPNNKLQRVVDTGLLKQKADICSPHCKLLRVWDAQLPEYNAGIRSPNQAGKLAPYTNPARASKRCSGGAAWIDIRPANLDQQWRCLLFPCRRWHASRLSRPALLLLNPFTAWVATADFLNTAICSMLICMTAFPCVRQNMLMKYSQAFIKEASNTAHLPA